MGHRDHHEKAKAPVSVFVVTVSDTRTEENDESGRLINELLAGAGHTLSGYAIVPDEPDRIKGLMEDLPAGTQAIILSGGTGISKRDGTFDAVQSMLDKTIPGFGELFRMLSYEEIGPAAIMSRATAGVMDGKIVISMPGSRGAVALAMEKIVIPELAHMAWEVSK